MGNDDVLKLLVQVIHDDMSLMDASAALNALIMGLILSKLLYSLPLATHLLWGNGVCINLRVLFNGSLIERLQPYISFPLGTFLITVQMLFVRNKVYFFISHLFLILITWQVAGNASFLYMIL
jgi:hypothetical protein